MGIYVELEDWNSLISDLVVIVIDMWNMYEICIGIFLNVIDFYMDSFCEFFNFVRIELDVKKYKKFVLFCIGGICCEKVISYFFD